MNVNSLDLRRKASPDSQLRRWVEEIEGWISEPVARLLYQLARQARGPVVEIGSWKGKSTLCLALGSRDTVYAIDPHTGSKEHGPVDTWDDFQSHLKAYQSIISEVRPLRMSSRQAFAEFKIEPHLVWIDGSHEYQDVLFDFHSWFERLAPGGVIAFHDSKWPGVRRVLWEEVFPHPLAGPIRRREDTTYLRKLKRPNTLCRTYNALRRLHQRIHQAIKRRKRRWRKKWSKNHFNL